MMGSMLRRGAISGGNNVVSILSELKAGTGYADVFVIGDSNVGYASATNQRGYCGGFFDALDGKGVKQYGTGLHDCAYSSLTYPSHGSPTSNGYIEQSQPTTSTTGGTTWSRGSALTTVLSDANIYKGDNLRASATNTKDFAYLQSSSNQVYLGAWFEIGNNTADANGLSCTQAVTVRLTFAKFPNQSTAQVGVLISGGLYGTTYTALTNATASPVLQNLDIPIAADANRAAYKIYHDANTSGKGPVGLLFRSVFRSVPGYAITNLQNYSGGTSTVIANSFSNATGCGSGTIATYCKAACERQVSAGASAGKVLVFINMGINNGTANAALNFSTDSAAIVSQFKAAWTALGYNDSNLGFIITCSHPTSAFDPTGANQGAATQFSSDSSVRFVDLQTLGINFSSYYDSGGQSHLSTSGYKVVSEYVLDSIA